MTNEFSFLEMQLIRSSLFSRTDEEIAELMERPVEKIREVINDMTGMAGQRQQELQEKRLQELVKKRPTGGGASMPKMKQENAFNNVQRKKSRRERTIIDSQAVRAADKKKKEEAKCFKTRVIDFTQLHSLRIDHRTVIFLRPGQDPEKVKSRYLSIIKNKSYGT